MRGMLHRIKEKAVSAIDPRPDYVRDGYRYDLQTSGRALLDAEALDLGVLYSQNKCQKDYYRSFLGNYIMHTWLEAFSLELVFNANPDIKRVVELGTGEGGFTIFLAVHMSMRGGEVITFDVDHNKMPTPTRKLLKALQVRAVVANVFAEETVNEIRGLLSSAERKLLICDNGDKEREFEVYAPFVRPGDLILVDDWRTEVRPEHLQPIMDAQGIEIVHAGAFGDYTNHVLMKKR